MVNAANDWKADYHSHTMYCDGKHTPREMIESAIEKGMNGIGLSGHSYVSFDEEWCMSKDGTKEYIREIQALKEEYKDRIQVFLGLEQDYYSEVDASKLDYIIGSVHYIKKNGVYLAVDLEKSAVRRDVNLHYQGDVYAYMEDYFALVGDIVRKTNCNVIGHFDLVTKFNQDGDLFDENHPRYVQAYQDAIQKILPSDVVFEINLGAIIRGYRTFPYPSMPVIEYIKAQGGRFLLNSDSHHKDTLMYDFAKWREYFQKQGIVVLPALPMRGEDT